MKASLATSFLNDSFLNETFPQSTYLKAHANKLIQAMIIIAIEV
jgi:hypothetical protein